MSRCFILGFIGCVLLAFLSYSPVQAHNYNNGYSYLTMKDNTVEYELLLPFPIMLKYDVNGDELLDDGELAAHKNDITEYVKTHLELFNNEQRMDADVLSLQTAVQKQTEDTVVRMILVFVSPMPMGNLSILYDLFIHDIDDGHQNYIQLYKDGHELVGHWIVEKDSGAIRYLPDGNFQFHSALLGSYVAFGAQHTIRSMFAWLILLCVVFPIRSMKESFISLSIASLYSLIGLTAADKLSSRLPVEWLHYGVLIALGGVIMYRLMKDLAGKVRLTSALFGLAWGTGSLSLLGQLQLNHQFKMVSLLLYASGGWLAWLGILYVLHIGVMQLPTWIGTRWSSEMGMRMLYKPMLILVFVTAWLVQ
ncbi:hypothetical protein [Paenibacillus sp. UNC451MF]|uniref:hypothetical protein n=1 Tax=Paenibacillus sp. UNC451MF TaxID=1449063 RepID=UPI0012DECC0A|nr:hypothetical protein [Paenibacillus sp. UNC451MF]